MKVRKRDGTLEKYARSKVRSAMMGAFKDARTKFDKQAYSDACEMIESGCGSDDELQINYIQDCIEKALIRNQHPKTAKMFILYRDEHDRIREWVKTKEEFISKYKQSSNTADATVDDNSNVSSKNIGILNNEIHKTDNIQISRKMVMNKLRSLYPGFDAKQYVRDLKSHIIYKHDESSFAGAIAPYCCSISMYPFLMNGIKDLGGLSAEPKNIDSFCGMYINLIFAVSSQFAGAVATSEFLVYFDYFARKEWGEDYWELDETALATSSNTKHPRTIRDQIHQYFQQVIYSINQPAAARGMQSAFVNFSYFDKPFFEGMFGDFYFPDGSKPVWESLSWLQKEFMTWFNQERTRTILTFPVESFALVYRDGEFADEDSADFVAKEYARGHSFFTYISDTVDSLSSCCRLKNMVQTKEFNFTNGNMGVMTGSKSVITMNLNRIVQDWYHTVIAQTDSRSEDRNVEWEDSKFMHDSLIEYIESILERVYKYHTAYNELLWDVYDANLLPVYSAKFIDLNKQYLTIGLNGLNQAAEWLGIQCRDSEEYRDFCRLVFGTVKRCNQEHAVSGRHSLTFNTEQVPAESLAVKNYRWDKDDGYWVPTDTNLYASYVFKPNDPSVSVLEKIRLHGRDYIGDYLDGGAAAHLNLAEHASEQQYSKLLRYAADAGCQYLTFNIPNSECEDCGWIGKYVAERCPMCGSTRISLWDRIIGYLTKIRNWSEGRRIEQKTRVYEKV